MSPLGAIVVIIIIVAVIIALSVYLRKTSPTAPTIVNSQRNGPLISSDAKSSANRAPNVPCNSNSDCTPGLTCFNGSCLSSAPVGASCSNGSFPCSPNEFCTNSSVCAALPPSLPNGRYTITYNKNGQYLTAADFGDGTFGLNLTPNPDPYGNSIWTYFTGSGGKGQLSTNAGVLNGMQVVKTNIPALLWTLGNNGQMIWTNLQYNPNNPATGPPTMCLTPVSGYQGNNPLPQLQVSLQFQCFENNTWTFTPIS